MGKTGGRKKGSTNKVTAERKARLAEFIEGHWDEFEKAYNSLDDPKDICKFFLDLMPYYAPRLQAVEYKTETPAKTFRDELDELSGEVTRK